MLGYWANRTTVNKAHMCVPYALQDGYSISNFKHVYAFNLNPKRTHLSAALPQLCMFTGVLKNTSNDWANMDLGKGT